MNGQEVISKILEELDIKASSFAKEIDEKYQRIYDIQKGKTKNISGELANSIVAKYSQFNINWLLTGEGEMLKSDKVEESMPICLPSSNFKLLPLHSFDVVGGHNNQEVDSMGYIMGYMPFVNAKDGDISVVVTGNSMHPTYPAGAYIQIRKIDHWKEYLEFGNVHIIELLDDRRLIKEVRKGCDKEHLRLISHNKDFDETEVSTDFIRSIWLVLAKYEKSTM